MPEPLSSNATTEVQPTGTAEDILDFFKTPSKGDKEEKPESPVGEAVPKPDVEEKEDEDIDLNEEDEDDDEDKPRKTDDEEEFEDEEAEIKVEVPPRKREILAKYPNLFKEFPFFEKMMFRDKQYTELFGSYDDAKDVSARAQILDQFEQDMINGDTSKLLSSVRNGNKKAFDKIVDNYLPTLANVDKEAYFEVIGNVGKHMIREMVNEARNSQNQELGQAALILNQFLFGTSTYTPPKTRVEEGPADNKDDELNRERANFTRERFVSARDTLQTKVNNVLRSTISEHIDPKGQMSAYEKKNAVKDALSMLHKNLGDDAGFRKTLDRLWEAAFQSRFDQKSLDRIRAAYLGRSKQSIASVIKRARTEALKGNTPSSKIQDDDDNEKEKSRKREITPGRPRQQSGKLKMERGESVLDFLSRD